MFNKNKIIMIFILGIMINKYHYYFLLFYVKLRHYIYYINEKNKIFKLTKIYYIYLLIKIFYDKYTSKIIFNFNNLILKMLK